jgi:deoxyribonuclease V
MLHPWNLTPKEAIALQRKLRQLIRFDDECLSISRIAGVDVSYQKRTKSSIAAVCVLSYPDLAILETQSAWVETPFPYVPGLLSFREIPPILSALEGLTAPPDLIFVDGHGQAHPRRMGIASHLGLWLKQPTIGVGKSRLCGEFEEPGLERGAASELLHQGEVIGKVVRTRTGVKPVFVSVGYGISLERSVELVLETAPLFRLPEPVRQADHLAAEVKKENRGTGNF